MLLSNSAAAPLTVSLMSSSRRTTATVGGERTTSPTKPSHLQCQMAASRGNQHTACAASWPASAEAKPRSCTHRATASRASVCQSPGACRSFETPANPGEKELVAAARRRAMGESRICGRGEQGAGKRGRRHEQAAGGGGSGEAGKERLAACCLCPSHVQAPAHLVSSAGDAAARARASWQQAPLCPARCGPAAAR